MENDDVQNINTFIHGVLGTFDVLREGAAVIDADFLNSHEIDNLDTVDITLTPRLLIPPPIFLAGIGVRLNID